MQQAKTVKKRWLASAIKAANAQPVAMPWQCRRQQSSSSIVRETPAQHGSDVVRA